LTDLGIELAVLGLAASFLRPLAKIAAAPSTSCFFEV
jgi:hypothetical protein